MVEKGQHFSSKLHKSHYEARVSLCGCVASNCLLVLLKKNVYVSSPPRDGTTKDESTFSFTIKAAVCLLLIFTKETDSHQDDCTCEYLNGIGINVRTIIRVMF